MPFRLDVNTTRLPSDDQRGESLYAASKLNRVGTPLAASMSQTSILPLTVRYTATRFPSGESSTLLKPATSGAPIAPTLLRDRSSHVSCRATSAAPVR